MMGDISPIEGNAILLPTSFHMPRRIYARLERFLSSLKADVCTTTTCITDHLQNKGQFVKNAQQMFFSFTHGWDNIIKLRKKVVMKQKRQTSIMVSPFFCVRVSWPYFGASGWQRVQPYGTKQKSAKNDTFSAWSSQHPLHNDQQKLTNWKKDITNSLSHGWVEN